MSFVDGENLTIQGQKLATARSLSIPDKGPYSRRNVFIWIPGRYGNKLLGSSTYPTLDAWATRANYYASFTGDDQTRNEVIDALRALDFHPKVFKKTRSKDKAKGVDIALTTDMLSHAFFGNYETAVLVTGDGDYLPLVEEVQRQGKRVVLWFFQESGLNPELLRVVDGFYDITATFLENWRNPNAPLRR
jgi:uncharacterized LabA/DUF88 family protein